MSTQPIRPELHAPNALEAATSISRRKLSLLERAKLFGTGSGALIVGGFVTLLGIGLASMGLKAFSIEPITATVITAAGGYVALKGLGVAITGFQDIRSSFTGISPTWRSESGKNHPRTA